MSSRRVLMVFVGIFPEALEMLKKKQHLLE